MKFLFILLILSFSIFKGKTQTWTQLPNLPFQTVLDTGFNAYYGTGFVIGSTIYYLPVDTSTLWAYNTFTSTWTPKAPFPQGIRVNASGFSIDSFGYITCGRNLGASPGVKSDLWRYSPASNTWTQKASIQTSTYTREYCISFVINNLGYLGTGKSPNVPGAHLTPYIQQFQEYNPVSDVWTIKAPVPDVNNPPFTTNGRGYASAFAFGGYGYVLNGIGNGSLLTDTRQYNPITNSWISLNPAFGNNVGGTGISDSNRGYLCFGQAGTSQTSYNFVWQLDSTLTWTPKSNFPGPSRKFSTGFTVGCNFYVLGGQNYNTANVPPVTNLVDFWKSTCNTLPINLLDFKAVCNSDDFENVQVTWCTASERNSKEFIIKIFADGNVYDKVVPAKGNSNQIVKYAASFSIPSGVGLNQATIGLIESDLDGNYTKVLEQYLTCENKGKTALVVFPNPSATRVFSISGAKVDPKLLKVVDALGREVHFVYSIYEDIMTLKLGERCQAGIYYLKYKDYSYNISLQY